MGNQDGYSRELSGWLRFLSGWMPDQDIYCKNSKLISKIEIDLFPVTSKESGVKLAILPLSNTKALLIESRRETKFSCKTSKPRNGVLVYALDLTLGHGQDFLIPVIPNNRNNMERPICNGSMSNSGLDILLYEGDKVNYDGLNIEVLKYDNFDKIIVTK